jgi:hypothetical protein
VERQLRGFVFMGINETLVAWQYNAAHAQPLQAQLKPSKLGDVTMTHYHIRWSGSAQLDWERFNTPGEAEESAKQLLRHGETYVIEEYDDTCPRCRAAMNMKSMRANFSQTSA